MSFILNALRKSEQERQTLQFETVTDKILLNHPQHNRSKSAILFAFLLIGNLLIIAGAVWFFRNDSTPTPDITAQTNSKVVAAQETGIKSEAITKAVQPTSPIQKTESKTVSIAEWADEKKPEKPVITKKPAADTLKQPSIVNKPVLPIQITPVIAPNVEVKSNPPETIPVKNDIPFLSDLPFEFRQSVPKITTNVFVYSKQAGESFVMIDMVKYKAGQEIMDKMLLKEIRPDSLVVFYQNRTFQIERQ